MTAQTPERIILDGRPRQLFADPLYRLSKHCRLNLANPHILSTGNYRGYIGTWKICGRRLYLAHLCWNGWEEVPISCELRERLLRAASSPDFPIHAHWFNGVVRIALGRRLVCSHYGWSNWFERERVIRFVAGEVVRDREVDTRAMLEGWLQRHPQSVDWLTPSNPHRPMSPLMWFDDESDDWEIDWWPPDYIRRP